ncbi:MAG: MFS transporter [Myxococcales bacterium]|nr:MFS transporter [Myxococcales bacterium]
MTGSPARPAPPTAAVLTTVLTISALYAPQPLLPVLQAAFGVSREAAAALTTVTFVPLALAPLAYGLLLERVPAARVLQVAVLALAASEFAFAAADDFAVLLVLRVGQGLLIPALLTAAMTFLSRRARTGGAPRALAVYVAATIVGGFLGRAVSGALAAAWGWRVSFVVLGVSLLAVAVGLVRLPGDAPPPASGRRTVGLGALLRRADLARAYGLIFTVFLVFAAIMNFLPFRLTELRPDADPARIGAMYAGYVMGVVSVGAGVDAPLHANPTQLRTARNREARMRASYSTSNPDATKQDSTRFSMDDDPTRMRVVTHAALADRGS